MKIILSDQNNYVKCLMTNAVKILIF